MIISDTVVNMIDFFKDINHEVIEDKIIYFDEDAVMYNLIGNISSLKLQSCSKETANIIYNIEIVDCVIDTDEIMRFLKETTISIYGTRYTSTINRYDNMIHITLNKHLESI